MKRSPAVAIPGPRQYGKSTLAKKVLRPVQFSSDTDVALFGVTVSNVSPTGVFLEGHSPLCPKVVAYGRRGLRPSIQYLESGNQEATRPVAV